MRRGFTLLEILASLLLAVMGVAAVIGMMRYATRLGVTAQLRMTAVATAETVLNDPIPAGRTADPGDADKDGWYGSGTLAVTAAATYDFSVYGWIDGYYVVRQESSNAVDRIDDASRWSTVTVHVYAGQEDEHLTSIRRRVLRRIPRGP
jgi:hypothetical protein